MIETERLVLRPYQLEDYKPYLEMVSDPDIDFPSRQLVTPEDAWHRLMRYVGHWTLLGYGNFAIIEKSTGEYVGETGLWDAHRGMGTDFDEYDEAGWFIARRSQGQGFATEAARAAHDWYDGLGRAPRTVCMIDPENHPSLRLAAKLGYQRFREGMYKDRRVVIFLRPLPKNSSWPR